MMTLTDLRPAAPVMGRNRTEGDGRVTFFEKEKVCEIVR